jgi:MoaA/NifB/PqqE/SkfB family radical SAM enzyme
MIESIKNYLKKFLPPLENNFNNELQKLEGEVTKLIPKTIINFGVPLVEHCNLKCCGCDHFAPIAEQSFANIGVFQNDFARLSELFNGEAVKIDLLGGEPLLHPHVKDFLYIARKYFPKTRIRIVSKGVLLLKQKMIFGNRAGKITSSLKLLNIQLT